MTFFFISYARKDGIKFADELNHRLDAAGLLGWIDREDLKVGKHWRPSLIKAIDSSLATLVVITPGSLESEYVLREWMRAEAQDKDVIPLLFTEIPPEYSDRVIFGLQWIDFRNPKESDWEQLIAKLLQTEAKLRVDPVVADAERILRSPSRSEWQDALFVLQTCEDESATEALVRCINGNIPEVSIKAAFALCQRTRWKDLRSIIGLNKALSSGVEYQQAVHYLERMDAQEAIDCLYENYRNSENQSHLREVIAEGIARIRDERVIPVIKELLKDEQNPKRRAMILALGRFGSASSIALPEIVATLHSWKDNSKLQVEVIQTLGQIGNPDAINPLLEVLKGFASIRYTEDFEVCEAIITAFRAMPSGSGYKALQTMLSDRKFGRFIGKIQEAIEAAKQNLPQT